MQSKVKYPDFGARMIQAADSYSKVPLANHGRLQWVADEMCKLGHKMAMETARKWFAGETMPRPKAAKLLAIVLSADQAWLTLGQNSTVSSKDAKSRNALANGAVNLLAGMIQMAGWNVAFPDKAAAQKGVDLYAIFRGAHYSFHVAVGKRSSGGWGFAVPIDALDNIMIGVCQVGAFSYELIELEREKLEEAGSQRAGTVEVLIPVGLDGWQRIESFSDRI